MLNWMLVRLGRFIDFGFAIDWYSTSSSLSRAVGARKSEAKLFRLARGTDQDACRTPGSMRLGAMELKQQCCAKASGWTTIIQSRKTLRPVQWARLTVEDMGAGTPFGKDGSASPLSLCHRHPPCRIYTVS